MNREEIASVAETIRGEAQKVGMERDPDGEVLFEVSLASERRDVGAGGSVAVNGFHVTIPPRMQPQCENTASACDGNPLRTNNSHQREFIQEYKDYLSQGGRVVTWSMSDMMDDCSRKSATC